MGWLKRNGPGCLKVLAILVGLLVPLVAGLAIYADRNSGMRHYQALAITYSIRDAAEAFLQDNGRLPTYSELLSSKYLRRAPRSLLRRWPRLSPGSPYRPPAFAYMVWECHGSSDILGIEVLAFNDRAWAFEGPDYLRKMEGSLPMRECQGYLPLWDYDAIQRQVHKDLRKQSDPVTELPGAELVNSP